MPMVGDFVEACVGHNEFCPCVVIEVISGAKLRLYDPVFRIEFIAIPRSDHQYTGYFPLSKAHLDGSISFPDGSTRTMRSLLEDARRELSLWELDNTPVV